MPKYANQIQLNSSIKLKDFISLQELPKIFANVTKAIGIFVDIWLGKEVDPTCLYNPKPTMNENTSSSSRPFTQSTRTNPVGLQPTGSLKNPKSQTENRRG